jgi:hypothetical protein
MNIRQLQADAKAAWKEHPELLGQIQDIVSDALDEIEQGGSEEQECDHAANAITELCK